MEQNGVIEIDLLKLVKALLKKAWLIILVAVIVAAAVFGCVKMTHIPSYSAASTLYVKGGADDTAYLSTSAATRIKTLIALLETRTVLEEISEAAGLGLAPEALSGMITAQAISGTEILKITTTDADPEEAVLLANATVETLRKNAEKIHGEDSLVIFEGASETTVKENGSKAVQKSVIAAVLAACLVCAWIAAKELHAQWKAVPHKNA